MSLSGIFHGTTHHSSGAEQARQVYDRNMRFYPYGRSKKQAPRYNRQRHKKQHQPVRQERLLDTE